jgi:multicomponent Na+:H+ antiporter subunit D
MVGVALLASLLSLYSLLKIWTGVFWKRAPAAALVATTGTDAGSSGGPVLMVVPTVVLAVVSIGMAVVAGPLYALSERAAADLLDPSAYLRVVLGRS